MIPVSAQTLESPQFECESLPEFRQNSEARMSIVTSARKCAVFDGLWDATLSKYGFKEKLLCFQCA